MTKKNPIFVVSFIFSLNFGEKEIQVSVTARLCGDCRHKNEERRAHAAPADTFHPLAGPLPGFSVNTLGSVVGRGGLGYNNIYQIENHKLKISLPCHVPFRTTVSKFGWPPFARVI